MSHPTPYDQQLALAREIIQVLTSPHSRFPYVWNALNECNECQFCGDFYAIGQTRIKDTQDHEPDCLFHKIQALAKLQEQA